MPTQPDAVSDPSSESSVRAASAHEPELAEWVEETHSRYPRVSITAEVIRAHLAHLTSRSLLHAVDPSHRVDLCVAAAAAASDSAAAELVSSWLDQELPLALARQRFSPAEQSEIAQLVRAHVLVGTTGKPALSDYAGQGPLRAWLRVTALRKGLNYRRDESRKPTSQRDDRLIEGLSSASEDPELRLLRTRCREELKHAFEHALSKLTSQDRTLLRQSFIDGLNDAQLGALHGVHRTTVLRWLKRAEESLMREVHKELKRALGVSSEELASMVRLLGSNLHISLRGHLV